MFPTPAARIEINSLSPCIFESPMMTPTSTAIGQVKAMTFGKSANVSCQTRFFGMLTLKKNVGETPCLLNKKNHAQQQPRKNKIGQN